MQGNSQAELQEEESWTRLAQRLIPDKESGNANELLEGSIRCNLSTKRKEDFTEGQQWLKKHFAMFKAQQQYVSA